MKKKTVCVVTGTRAEYGLLRGVVKKLAQSRTLAVRLVVTGAHLAQEFGMTVREIEADGVPLAARIPILKFGTGTALATAKTTAYALEQFIDYFTAHRPDMVLMLGDRYEIFAVGQAAALLGIPLAHISGGDVTYGAADDYFRHCLTKMASLHFPACEEYAARVVRHGRGAETVHCVGGLGDENIRSLPLLEKPALAQSLGLALARPYALVTYHPETAAAPAPLHSLRRFCARWQALTGWMSFLQNPMRTQAAAPSMHRLTRPAQSSRPLGRVYKPWRAALPFGHEICGGRGGKFLFRCGRDAHLPRAAVNIGARQKGRIICANVLCCEADEASIRTAVETALSRRSAKRRPGAKAI